MSTTSTNPDGGRGREGDRHTDVDAAQADADNEPVEDERTPPAPDEDRNP